MNKIIAKSKDELYMLIKDEINKNGNECDLNHIDVSEIKDLNFLFLGSEFNGNISAWNVSKAQSMYNPPLGCKACGY